MHCRAELGLSCGIRKLEFVIGSDPASAYSSLGWSTADGISWGR